MFQFSLAKELGKTYGELLASMTASELALWHIYAQIQAEDHPSP